MTRTCPLLRAPTGLARVGNTAVTAAPATLPTPTAVPTGLLDPVTSPSVELHPLLHRPQQASTHYRPLPRISLAARDNAALRYVSSPTADVMVAEQGSPS